jgi:serine/threonine-protein kinase
MNEPLDHLESLFAATLQKPAAQRAAYLDEACGDDPALRRRVEELLIAQDAAGSFLQVSAPAPEVTLGQSLTERPGAAIGPYKLLQQLGEEAWASCGWQSRRIRCSARLP